ncbi:MAG: nucleotidyltransferase family protein [Thermoplasmata archaeon]|nr:nucleotidyltransferase family protein [Thermoplasmata archaeon]
MLEAPNQNREGGNSERRAAVVLAAGASIRFGGYPKALLSIWGETALERVTRICRDSGFSPVVVVVGRHAREIRDSLRSSNSPPDEMVENTEWEAGRTGSVQVGLAAVDPRATVLLWPVDCPLGRPASVRALSDRARAEALGLWFLPTYEGRGGHPVLLQPAVLPRVLGMRKSAPLRSLLPELGPQVVRVPVPDPGVTVNLNTPAQYEEAVRARNLGEEPWTGR